MNATFASLLSISLLFGSGLGASSGLDANAVAEQVRAQQPTEAAKAPAWRPDKASEILVMVQAFYDGTADLEAKFKQTYWNPAYNEARNTSGKLVRRQLDDALRSGALPA